MISQAEFYGGSQLSNLPSNEYFYPSLGRFAVYKPTGGPYAVILPDARTLKLGGVQALLINQGPALCHLRLNDGTFALNFNVGYYAKLWLVDNTTQNGTWGLRTGMFDV